MKLIVSGVHRSGQNVIGRWLLRQSDLKKRNLDLIYGDWVEANNFWDIETFGFISQINHPEHEKEFARFQYDNMVWTIERESIKSIMNFKINHDLPYTTIIIIRSFDNWLASALKMGHVTDLDISKYKSHLDFYCNFPEQCIVYDTWVTSKEYREEICDRYNLTFTDYGIDDVPKNGGGSSFDKLDYDGNASKMDVLNRVKGLGEVERHRYNFLVNFYEEILRKSNEHIKNR